MVSYLDQGTVWLSVIASHPHAAVARRRRLDDEQHYIRRWLFEDSLISQILSYSEEGCIGRKFRCIEVNRPGFLRWRNNVQ